MLQSHLFTDTERDSILGNLEYYTVDEATANVKWVLEQIPIRKEQERKDAANELWQVVANNKEALDEQLYLQLETLCHDGKTTTAKYLQLKEELMEQLIEAE